MISEHKFIVNLWFKTFKNVITYSYVKFDCSCWTLTIKWVSIVKKLLEGLISISKYITITSSTWMINLDCVDSLLTFG